jgi:2-dehydro-3-deoxygluconokinase
MKVICFGEVMLKLSPFGFQRFIQANSFQAEYAGSEANVAVSLSKFGIPTAFVTKVPDNDLGDAAINTLSKYSVKTEFIKKDNDGRIGIYFVEKGASQRPSKVIYDRKNSVISLIKPNEFNWEDILSKANWLHFSGISLALSTSLQKTLKTACFIAKEKKIPISCDINYRKNLWSIKEAKKVLYDFLPNINICISSEDDYDKILDGNISLLQDNNQYKDELNKTTKRLGLKTLAITLRESITASYNKWSALLYINNKAYKSCKYEINVIDRIGAGDSFSAGLIYSFIKNKPYQDCLNFATAASCLKHSIEGDYNLLTTEEVNNLVIGNSSGRIVR